MLELSRIRGYPSQLALHESGHMTIASLLGHSCLYAVLGDHLDDDGHPCGGSCRYVDGIRLSLHTPHERKMLAVAGVAATAYAGIVAGLTIDPIAMMSNMSPSDWKGTREPPGRMTPALAAAFRSVLMLYAERPVWREVVRIARRLDRDQLAVTPDAMEWYLSRRAGAGMTAALDLSAVAHVTARLWAA